MKRGRKGRKKEKSLERGRRTENWRTGMKNGAVRGEKEKTGSRTRERRGRYKDTDDCPVRVSLENGLQKHFNVILDEKPFPPPPEKFHLN